MWLLSIKVGEVFLYAGVGQSRDSDQDGNVRANRLAGFPHFKHRVVDKLLNDVGAESCILKKRCEVREVPKVELLHRTAITGANECEECPIYGIDPTRTI